MLSQVRIQNYALIDDIRINFTEGLNVLTGETGAGKSILIDALRLCFGDRAESIAFKDSSHPCVIEATIDCSEVENRLGRKITQANFGVYLQEGDDLLVFKREILTTGKSKNSINGQLVNLSLIRNLASLLLDWHGQYDFQAIFQPSAQLAMVDHFAKSESLLKDYKSVYSEYASLLEQHRELTESMQNRDQQIDLLKFQVNEIEQINPVVGEDVELKSEVIRFSHAEKLHEKTKDLLSALDDGDDSASIKISSAFRPLFDLEKIDENFSSKREALESIQVQLEEWIAGAREYQESLSFDESSARESESRLNSLDNLKKKYGGTLEAVISFFKQAKQKLNFFEDSDLCFKELDKKIAQSFKLVEDAGKRLTIARAKAAAKLSKKVCAELEELGMKQAKFVCKMTSSEPSSSGLDKLEFFLAPNVGLEAQPLTRIASGGEASRVMLAIKKVAGDSDRMSTLVFDEIDANIGGRLGSIVGQKLREIAANHQVLLITHLPQIAAFGNHHLKVVKTMSSGKTQISYEILTSKTRVSELAQMMSGQEETAISLKHAQELLQGAEAV